MGIKRSIKQNTEAIEVLLFDAFEEFVTEKELKNLSEATINNYKHTFKTWAEFNSFDRDTGVDEVTSHSVYKWVGTMKLNGKKPSSLNHHLRDIRTFLYWCMDSDREYIKKPFKVEMVLGQEEAIKLFKDEDIEKLLEKPKRNGSFVDWRTWAVVNWVLGTGNRAATICNVKIGDINYSKREITLAHTKNKKAQIIPLSSSLETVIKEYIRMWRRDANNDDWLFCNIGEDKLTTNALIHSFSKYCESRGVEQTNIHGLRHNFAKGWVQNNGNMFALQKVLGHSGLDMTRRYVRLFSEDIKEDFDKFSPLDNIKRNSKRTQKVKKSEY
jgi:integrase/recombinase XerD